MKGQKFEIKKCALGMGAQRAREMRQRQGQRLAVTTGLLVVAATTRGLPLSSTRVALLRRMAASGPMSRILVARDLARNADTILLRWTHR